jgi:hypothetical protein
MNFTSYVIVPGRTYISSLIQTSTKVKHLEYHVTLDREAKADIAMWLKLLDSWDGVSLFRDTTCTLADLTLFTDSSAKHGFGGWYEQCSEYFYGMWQNHYPEVYNSKWSMAWMELYPIVVACVLWSKHWSRKTILFVCDNAATVAILCKGRCKCPKINKLMRHLVLLSIKMKFSFGASWIASKENGFADMLSSNKISEF